MTRHPRIAKVRIPFKPVLAALAPIEEVLNRGFDELIHVLYWPAANSFLTRFSISGDRFTFMSVPRFLTLRQTEPSGAGSGTGCVAMITASACGVLRWAHGKDPRLEGAPAHDRGGASDSRNIPRTAARE